MSRVQAPRRCPHAGCAGELQLEHSRGSALLFYTCGHTQPATTYRVHVDVPPSGAVPTANGHVAAAAVARTITAAELLSQHFPDAQPVVPQILYQGAMLLAGRPKTGKSWLALPIAVAVAYGGRALGTIAVEGGDDLYCALEDGERRLQARLRDVLGEQPPPARLHLATEWRRFDEGGLDDLRLWLAGHPAARLVVFDTLKRVRPRGHASGRLYDLDYDAVAPLNDLAHQYGVCILIVHHTRKMDADDPMDLISGSLGLTGAVDGAAVLKRSRGEADATLAICHRDAEDAEFALRWDVGTGGWLLLGSAEEYRRSGERTRVLDVLRAAPAPPPPKEVAELLGKSRESVRFLLHQMAKDGEVKATAAGGYVALVPHPSPQPTRNIANSPNRPQSPETNRVNPVSEASATANRPLTGANRPLTGVPEREPPPVSAVSGISMVGAHPLGTAAPVGVA